MKLRTDLDDFPAEVWTDDLRHDAMAAHALLQVIEQCTGKVFSEYAGKMMKERAAEILAGWLGEAG